VLRAGRLRDLQDLLPGRGLQQVLLRTQEGKEEDQKSVWRQEGPRRHEMIGPDFSICILV
jgi:hypothetical protein